MDLGLAGIVQDSVEVYFLELERLWREEIRDKVLGN